MAGHTGKKLSIGQRRPTNFNLYIGQAYTLSTVLLELQSCLLPESLNSYHFFLLIRSLSRA